MWLNNRPIDNNWGAGPIVMSEVLYAFGEPIIFRSNIGLNDFLIAKRDQSDDVDFYLAVETNEDVISALKEGRISLRGALLQKEAWILAMNMPNVHSFQYVDEESLYDLVPERNIGLFSRFGEVPDTIEQADALISFRFLGNDVRDGIVPLAVFQEKVNQFASFVRKALTPNSLHNGRDSRFFDVTMAEPRFTSLVISATGLEFDTAGINRSRRLNDVNVDGLREEAIGRGVEFWNSLEFATEQIERTGRLSDDFVNLQVEFLENLEGLVPKLDTGISRVEITFNDGNRLHTALLDQRAGTEIVDAQDRLRRLERRSLTGVIVEVNGDSGTLIMKDLASRQTTCTLDAAVFEILDGAGELRRGRQIRVDGDFKRRTRRDLIDVDGFPVFLN